MKKSWMLGILLFAGITPAFSQGAIDSALKEADTSFTYRGKPIHPFLFETLSNDLSDDRPPMATTVDIAAAYDSNMYTLEDTQKRDSWWFSERRESLGPDMNTYESFDYRWLGKMSNGVHVVETGSSGSGSGFFMDLMFIKFSEGEIYWDNKRTPQLLMTIVGTHILGDRYEGEIKVYPDKVFIPASKDQHGGGSMDTNVEISATNFS